jgi:hypothetical protein
MSQLPACKHTKHKAKGPPKDGVRWLGLVLATKIKTNA